MTFRTITASIYSSFAESDVVLNWHYIYCMIKYWKPCTVCCHVPFRRLCGPWGLAAGAVPWAASVLGRSLLSQLSTLGGTSLSLSAQATKWWKRGWLRRGHPTARLTCWCHQAAGRCRAIDGSTGAVAGNRGASCVPWALLAGRGARCLCGWRLVWWGKRLSQKRTVQWLWCEVRSWKKSTQEFLLTTWNTEKDLHLFTFNLTLLLLNQPKFSSLPYFDKIKWYQRCKWGMKRFTKLSTQ